MTPMHKPALVGDALEGDCSTVAAACQEGHRLVGVDHLFCIWIDNELGGHWHSEFVAYDRLGQLVTCCDERVPTDIVTASADHAKMYCVEE